MTHIAAAFIFIGFVALAGLTSASSSTDTPKSRKYANWLICYTVLFSLVAGFSHRELWPFSRWNIFSERLTQPVHEIRLYATDREGKEYEVDRRAVEPFTSIDLYTWFDFDFAKLSDQQKSATAEYLLAKIEQARQDALKGNRVGNFSRYFGPLTAPAHILHAEIWNDPANVPTVPFAGFRIYRYHWNVFARRDDPSKFEREQLYEFTASRGNR